MPLVDVPHRSARRRWWLCLPLLAACEGKGSDIGPRFPTLSNASSKVTVFDDQGRGVVGATVTVPERGHAATTGINGRADLLADPRGRLLVRVDGTHAAAVSGDRLGVLTFAATVVRDLPVVHLPDLPDSASAPIFAGTQMGTTAVTSVIGAICTVGAGSSVGLPDSAASGFLRLGDLQAQHLPGDLPGGVPGMQLLFTAGVLVAPADATFLPGATLDVADELGLPGSATATLFRLDAVTGEWVAVVTGIPSSGGRLVAANAVTQGGLYAFATAVPAAAVTGRVRNAIGTNLGEQLVNVDGRWTVTDGSGRFVVSAVPAVLADGSARSASVEVHAGGSWLPQRVATTAAVTSGSTTGIGDVTFDTAPSTTLRFQQIRRGRGEPRRRVAVSAAQFEVARVGFGDEQGQCTIEDMPTNWFGFQAGHPLDADRAYYGQQVAFLVPGRRRHDVYQFFDELGWVIGARRTRVYVSDRVGTGPIHGAGVVTGSTPGQGFRGTTIEFGSVLVDRGSSGRITATFGCDCVGVATTSAVTVVSPDGEHMELPLERSLQPTLAAFDRHGLVAGDLLGANVARTHELRSTRWLEAAEWWDDVVEGVPIPARVPLDVDPGVTHADFVVGVDAIGGHLVASELAVAGPVRTLEKLGVALALTPTEGGTIARDLPLDLPATTPFTVPDGLVGLDASIAAADLRVDLTVEQPNARVVDAVRDLGGNHAAAGTDLSLTLPALTGPLANHAWRALVRGSATVGGEVLEQRTIVRLTSAATQAAVAMLPVPTLTAPANGASVAAAGFTVAFALPPGADYGRIDLVHEMSGERRSWRVYVPPSSTEFAFVTLPTQVTSPLIAGRTWSLTLSAYRSDGSVLSRSVDIHRDVTTFLQSVSPIELGVVAISSRTITVTTH